MRDLRRVIVTLVIASFSAAALLGILALLGGGEFGATQGRVLLTTVIVGIESTVVLCLLTLAGHRWAPLAVVGGLASAVATGAALTLAWAEFAWDAAVWEVLWKTFGVSAITAGTAAQLALLIALTLRPRGVARLGTLLAGTGTAATVVAAMAIFPILGEVDPGGAYWRTFGVLAILDVLGSVVLTALGAFGRARAAGPARPQGRTDATVVRLDAVQEQQVARYAASHGTTPARVLADAVEQYLSAS